jgi:hypothetical protein
VPGRALTRLAPVVLVLAAALTACGGDGDTDSPATEESTSSTSDSPAEPGSESGSESGSSSTGDGVTVTVTREGDSFTPNGERVELGVDQPLVLTIEADEAGELHVHSTPEQEIAYDKGTTEHEITIDRPGVVEVESHEPDTVVLQLEVR